jgi:HEAT repeat protein
VLTDRNETKESRAVAMELLHANRNKLSAAEMKQFLNETTTIAKNINADETLSTLAVRTMGNVTLTMKELGQINEAESKKEMVFLMEAATNSEHGLYFQASAINTLGILDITESSPLLHRILEDNTNMNVPEISRPACLSLMRVDGERAIPTLRRVLQKTTDSRVFGTAAFAIGQIKKSDSLVALMENQERSENSGSCDAVLVDMDGVILDILKSPKDPNLEAAIRATCHLWRDGQRDRYMPMLKSLITTAPMATRKIAIERFLEVAGQMDFDAEKKALADVQPAVVSQPELAEYAQRIKNRLSAVLLAPSNGLQQIPTPKKGGN